MGQAELESLFQKFKTLKVLIVGDVMVDNYIMGKVERVSPEAPVPVVDVSALDSRLGGAGNVALNILSMGASPVLCSVVGSDKQGKELTALLKVLGLTDRAMHASEKRKTTTKTRVIGNNHQIVRIDHEITDDLDTLDSYLLEQHYDRELEFANVVILEDYNKGVLHSQNIERFIQKAKSMNIPVVVDPKKSNFLAYKGASLFKPNLKELKEGLNLNTDLKDIDNLRSAVEILTAEMNVDACMVTMSEKGVYIHSNTEEHNVPAHIRNITDVSGAGDTVISIAALCTALNVPLKDLAELSNLAGGLVCEETGVVPIDPLLLKAEALKEMAN
jgi:rfaE bifunctional protein kinase chain/domain